MAGGFLRRLRDLGALAHDSLWDVACDLALIAGNPDRPLEHVSSPDATRIERIRCVLRETRVEDNSELDRNPPALSMYMLCQPATAMRHGDWAGG